MGKSNRVPTIFLGSVLVLCVAFLCLSKIHEADTWWHLKTGQLIWESGIPRVDPFSYVIGGKPWVAFEWLSQALFFQLFDLGGAGALTGFKGAVVLAVFLLLWRLNPDRPAWSACVTLAAALACRQSFVARPFIFDYLFVAGMTFTFWRISFRTPPPALRWILPLGTLLWANLHGGAALLAPLLTTAAAAAEWRKDPEVPLKFWAQTAALSAAALLINPHGPAILGHLWNTMAFPARDLITEWHAPTWEFRRLYGLFLLGGAAAALPTLRKKPFAAAWLLLLGLASLQMKRNIPLYLIIAAPAITAAFGPKRWAGAGPAAIAASLLMVLGVWGHTVFAYPRALEHIRVGEDLPFEGALKFCDETGIEGRMFNEYESGGPIIWRAGPRRKVFVDGRSLEYGPEHIRRAMSWYRPDVWAELDEEFDFDYALLRRHTLGAYTASVLDARRDWVLVYWDDASMVYLKARAGRVDLVRKYGYSLLQPGRSSFQYIEGLLRRGGLSDRILAELDRTLVRAPACVNALLAKSYVLSRRGSFEAAAIAARRAVEAYPGKARPRLTLGWVLSADGDLEGGRRAYSEGLARVTRAERATLGADILNNLGRLAERMGDSSRAARLYESAIRWNPRQADARHNLERLTSKSG